MHKMRNISNVCLRRTSDVRRMANLYKKTTHGHQLRCYCLEEDAHGAHHLYLDILQNQVTRLLRITKNTAHVPGGSILQMSNSLKSSLSLHSGTFPLGETTHSSPSFGKHSSTALPNGLYGTSNSNSRLSCSASFPPTFPRALTK
jgi:hypothetical protein